MDKDLKIGDLITIYEIDNQFSHIDDGIGLDFEIENGELLYDDGKTFINIFYDIIENYTGYNGLVKITRIHEKPIPLGVGWIVNV